MTSRRCRWDPPPDPNPNGPTPGVTPRSAQKTPGLIPSADSPSQGTSGSKGRIMKGRYTCYVRPCVNCADPFPSHLTSEWKEAMSVNIGLRLLWSSMTHRGVRLLAQAHRSNTRLTEDNKPCDVCETDLKENDLWECIMKARVRSDF